MTTELPEVNFSQAEALIAFRAWKCNCGPAALAAILGMRLFEVRPACEYVGFANKGYMDPTMMESAIPLAGGHLVKKKSAASAASDANRSTACAGFSLLGLGLRPAQIRSGRTVLLIGLQRGPLTGV